MNPSILLAVFLLAAPCRAADPAADAPFNLAAAPPEMRARVNQLRGEIQTRGYRFDDDAGTIIDPRTQKPALNKQIEDLLKVVKLAREHTALARIAGLLKDQDPAAPVPADTMAQINAIVAQDQDALAPTLLKAVAAARNGPAGSLRADVLSAYADLNALFDGAESFGDRLSEALPVAGGWSRSPVLPSYVNDAERELGERIKKAAAAYFDKPGTGAELLNNFKDAQGVVALPDMLVLKIQDFAAASYSSANRAVICNFGPVRDAIVAAAPPSDQRALAARLKTPKDLNDYLAQEPNAIDAFLRANDLTLFHELTHAWQDKRGRLSAEQNRGNAPENSPFESEWEAYRNQNRRLHELLMTDPDAALRSRWIDDYRRMLADYDGWQDDITRQYLELMPAGAASLPEMRSMQRLRRRTAVDGLSGDLVTAVRSLLKLVGLQQGSQALTQAEADFNGRTEAFKKDALPKMRVEGNMALAAAYEKRGEYRDAFQCATAAEGFAEGTPDAAAATAAAQRLSDKTLAWVRKGQGDPDSLAAALSIVAERNEELKKPPLDGYNDLVVKTYLRACEAHLSSSQDSRNPDIQKRERDAAQQYLDALASFKTGDVPDPKLRDALVKMRANFGLGPEGKP